MSIKEKEQNLVDSDSEDEEDLYYDSDDEEQNFVDWVGQTRVVKKSKDFYKSVSSLKRTVQRRAPNIIYNSLIVATFAFVVPYYVQSGALPSLSSADAGTSDYDGAAAQGERRSGGEGGQEQKSEYAYTFEGGSLSF